MSGTLTEKRSFTWDYLGLGDNSSCPKALVLFFDERRRTSLSSLQRKEGWDDFGKVKRCDRLRDGGLEVAYVRVEDPDAKGIPVHCLQTGKETSRQRCGLDLKGSKGRYSDRLATEISLKSSDFCSLDPGLELWTIPVECRYLTKTGSPATMLLATLWCIKYKTIMHIYRWLWLATAVK